MSNDLFTGHFSHCIVNLWYRPHHYEASCWDLIRTRRSVPNILFENKEGTFRGEATEVNSKTCNPLPNPLSKKQEKRKDKINIYGHIFRYP